MNAFAQLAAPLVSAEPLDSTRIGGRTREGRKARAPNEGTRAATAPGGRLTVHQGDASGVSAGRLVSREVVVPRHVQHCYETGSRDWWVYTWRKGVPSSSVLRVPYRCSSWRCPVCRRHEGAVTFARTKEAFEGIEDFDPTRLAFAVLTLDRDGYYSGEPWADERAAYAALSRMSRMLLKRINRHCVKQGWEPVGRRWVATVEAHRSGWPHLQIAMYVPRQWADEMGTRNERKEKGLTLLSGWFADALRGCGWGRVGTLERADSSEAVYGYLTKTAGHHEQSVGRMRGELIKLSQLPTNAPVRFRRLRAGKGFLPPRRKNLAVTGTLVRRSWDRLTGVPLVQPLHDIKDAAARALSAECCYEEQRLWDRENETRETVKLWRRIWPAAAAALETPELWSFRPRPPPPACVPPEPLRVPPLQLCFRLN